MEAGNAFDQLADNLESLGLRPETHLSENTYLIPAGIRLASRKFVIAPYGSCFFFASDSYGSNAQASSTFTGIYREVSLHAEEECLVRQKVWTDRFLTPHKRKTGIGYIDKNLTITSPGWVPTRYLTHDNVSLFLELCRNTGPMFFVIQQDYLPMMGPLRGKKVAGIETRDWIFERSQVDMLLQNGSRFLEMIR